MSNQRQPLPDSCDELSRSAGVPPALKMQARTPALLRTIRVSFLAQSRAAMRAGLLLNLCGVGGAVLQAPHQGQRRRLQDKRPTSPNHKATDELRSDSGKRITAQKTGCV